MGIKGALAERYIAPKTLDFDHRKHVSLADLLEDAGFPRLSLKVYVHGITN
jgi:hypothetical protein